ncbi:MAG TPA: hypothetical protein VFL92_06415 [Sphingomonas sp.]|nr:hypothetical protein [Sphingomonas sp.]
MSGGQWMVVMIVAIVMIARVVGGPQMSRRWRRRGYDQPQPFADTAENQRLREEVRALKERIAVLERIATDSSTALDREIDALRDRH